MTRPRSSNEGVPWWWIVALALPAWVWVACETIWPWLSAMDCAWQEGNACARILGGDLPGRDFQLFHGVGAAWLHMPLFLLGGAGERAVAFTHYGTAVLACTALAWMVFGAVAGGRARVALAAGTISVFCVVPWWRDWIDPLGNMASTRSAIGGMVAFGIARLDTSGRGRILSAILLGWAAACFADLAAILVLTAAGWGLVRVAGERNRRAWLAFAPLAGLALVPVWQWVLCGGHPGRLWDFQWRILPGAQTWFWAPTQPFIRDFSDLLCLTDRRVLCAVAGQSLAWWLGGRHPGGPSPALRRIQVALILFSAASLLPILGHCSIHYFHTAALMGSLSLVAALWPLACFLADRCSWKAPPWWPVVFALVLGGLREHRTWAGCPFGSRDLEPALRQHQSAIQGPVWSFYRGPLDHRLGQKPLPEEDLIIYAVGSRRAREYAQAFGKAAPEWVLTPAGAPFNDWLAVRYWETHRELLAQYDPVLVAGPWATWRRTARPVESLASFVPVRAEPDGGGWRLKLDVPLGGAEAGSPVLVECFLRHRSVSPPLGRQFCRWVVKPASPQAGPEFSLDPAPEVTETSFPLNGRAGATIELRLDGRGLWPVTRLEISEAGFRVLPSSWRPGWQVLMQGAPTSRGTVGSPDEPRGVESIAPAGLR